MTTATPRYGALPGEWIQLSLVLGLTEDLLPVVSNPAAQISPDSKMGGIGKTPSRYNHNRLVAGIPDWTQRKSNSKQIAAWQGEPDYGICIQTRRIRALDVDVADAAQAVSVRAFIDLRLNYSLPARCRSNSPKFLLAFECPGELYKRRIKTAHGMIELLATGQQFIASGTHPSGVRYEWEGGLPDEFPVLSFDQLEELWQALQDEFGIEEDTRSEAPSKHERLAQAIGNDPVAQKLSDLGMVKRTERDGRLHINCPFEEEHTSESGDSSTTYWPAHTGGYVHGHFHCLHAHCEGRSDQEFKDAIGYVDEEALADFATIEDATPQTLEGETPHDTTPATADDFNNGDGDKDVPPGASVVPPNKFQLVPVGQFASVAPTAWLIKHILPDADLVVTFGDSGSGKSFLAIDMSFAIALGQPWRGNKVQQGRVVYVAAEGAGGARKRFSAYAQHHNIDLSSVPIDVLAGAPNLLNSKDVRELILAIKAGGPARLVVLDTFAQTTAGGNENSGEDVGLALQHCKVIRQKTGAMIHLIHHSGKDSTKGARGWSGLRAACDTEIEVVRDNDARSFRISKQKDGEDGTDYDFKLEVVELGKDPDGEEITSCVVGHLSEHTHALRVPRKLGPKQLAVWGKFNELADLGNGRASVAEVLDAVVATIPLDVGARDTRRQTAKRALMELIEMGRLEVKEGNWLALGAVQKDAEEGAA